MVAWITGEESVSARGGRRCPGGAPLHNGFGCGQLRAGGTETAIGPFTERRRLGFPGTAPLYLHEPLCWAAGSYRAAYVFVKLFRVLVTVKLPSGRAETFR